MSGLRDSARNSLRKVNELIFHTFNSLKKQSIQLNGKDPAAFVEAIRRGFGVQQVCCDELCFVISIVCNSLVSKTIRFVFHSFSESLDLVLNYLVKPENFNRTMNTITFENLSRQVDKQLEKIKQLETTLHLGKGEGAGDGNWQHSVDGKTMSNQKEDTAANSAHQGSTVDNPFEVLDFKLTDFEHKKLDDLIRQLDRGYSLDLANCDMRILVGLKSKINSLMLEDNNKAQKRLEETLKHLEELRISPARAMYEMQSLTANLKAAQFPNLELKPVDRDLVVKEPQAITDPIIKSLLESVDDKQRTLAVGDFSQRWRSTTSSRTSKRVSL